MTKNNVTAQSQEIQKPRLSRATMTKILNVEDELSDAVAVLAFVESALNSECAGCELNIPAETCGFDPARPISIVRRMIGRLIEDLADVERDINGEMRHAPKKRAKKAA